MRSISINKVAICLSMVLVLSGCCKSKEITTTNRYIVPPDKLLYIEEEPRKLANPLTKDNISKELADVYILYIKQWHQLKLLNDWKNQILTIKQKEK